MIHFPTSKGVSKGAQYFSLYSWLFWPTVLSLSWRRAPSSDTEIVEKATEGQQYHYQPSPNFPYAPGQISSEPLHPLISLNVSKICSLFTNCLQIAYLSRKQGDVCLPTAPYYLQISVLTNVEEVSEYLLTDCLALLINHNGRKWKKHIK